MVVGELHVQLLSQEKALDNREGVIIAWEDGLAASEHALGRVCMECGTERAQAEDVW
jgi:hypothetical protein